jgi:hypothetical protein
METILSISGISAFIILFITKVKIREYLQTFGPKIISKLMGCDFCLSFWTNVILIVVFVIFTHETKYLYLIFVNTPITRILI